MQHLNSVNNYSMLELVGKLVEIIPILIIYLDVYMTYTYQRG